MNFFKVILRKIMIISLLAPTYNSLHNTFSETMLLGSTSTNIIDSDLNVDRQLDTPAAFYFNNLRENVGYNQYNSCLYVAACGILSYYDTYLNDDFIDERFTICSELKYSSICEQYFSNEYCESPGIYNDKDKMQLLGDNDEMNNIGVYDIEEQIFYYGNIENYFQFYLLNFAKENELLSDFPLSDLNFTNSASKIKELLNLYIQQQNVATEDAFEFLSGNINDQVVDLVKSGQPVICSLVDSTSPIGHAIIAYDYIEGFSNPEDGLVFNMGWEGNYAITFAQVKNLTTYYKISSGLYLDESKIVFSHSKKYFTVSSELTCMCYLHCNKHSYTVYFMKFKYYDDIYHRYYCSYCRQYYYEEHCFVTIDDSKGALTLPISKPYELCLTCRYRRE